jgi:hypothetical protein
VLLEAQTMAQFLAESVGQMSKDEEAKQLEDYQDDI